MADYPTRGFKPWDDLLKAYLDEQILAKAIAAVGAAPSVVAAAASAVTADLASRIFPAQGPVVATNQARNPFGVSSGSTADWQARWSWTRTTPTSAAFANEGNPTGQTVLLTAPSGVASGTNRGFDFGPNLDNTTMDTANPVHTAYPVTPGETITVSYDIRAVISAGPYATSPLWGFYDASGNRIGTAIRGSDVNLPSGLVRREAATFTVPASAAYMSVRAGSSSSGYTFAAADTIQGSNILVERSSGQSVAPFSGASAGARWTGTPNASSSQLIMQRASDLRYGPNGAPVALNRKINPRLVVDSLTGWAWGFGTGGAGTNTRVASGGPNGWAYAEAVVTTASTGGSTQVPLAGAAEYPLGSVNPGDSVGIGYLSYTSASKTMVTVFDWYNAAGTYLSSSTVTRTSPAGAFEKVVVHAVAPGSTSRVVIQNRVSGIPAVGETYRVTGVSTDKTTMIPAYFDGSFDQARWVGAAHGSIAELAKMRSVDISDVSQIAVRYLEGAGSPLNRVSAPGPGWHYTDTAATNGAVEWISTSAGLTGWRVLFGDTGWRIIAQWNASGTITTGALNSPWAPRTDIAGQVMLRRINDDILARWNGLRATAAIGAGVQMINIPAGFGFGAYPNDHTSKMLRGAVPTIFTMSALARGTAQGTQADDLFDGSTRWTAAESWPTALPGIAG